jgi:hypothetical protein
MSKKITHGVSPDAKTVATKELTAKERKELARTFTDTYSAVAVTGEAISIALATAVSKITGKARAIDAPSLDAVVADVAQARKWSEATIPVRKSEIATLLYAMPELPALCTGFKKKAGGLQWHNTVSMARRVKAGDTVAQAITYVAENNGKNKKPIKGKADAIAKLTTLTKQMLKIPYLPADTKLAITEFVTAAGIKV